MCPCGSNIEYEKCCAPFLAGKSFPDTAEALMRARYTAFVKGDIDFIYDTRHPRSENKFNRASVTHWSKDSKWHGLKIIKTKDGKSNDQDGTVEFTAQYTLDGEKQVHNETALFKKEDNRWYFIDGNFIKPETFHRKTEKIGRNDLCPCGSGKKYKKCCGK
jgi:SEC-C motif-containing protein